MVLTREEKERLVLDLYNRRTPIREIAREAGMSFRDIGRIIDKKEKEKEAMEGQVQKITQSTQAYKLFSDGKSPIQVAVALNLREPEVAKFYVEYWKLSQLHSLNWVYEQVKDNIGYFVSLYIAAKVARMDVQHVIRLLEIANNDLPSVEYRCERRKREVDDLEAEKQNLNRILQDLKDQVVNSTKNLEHYNLSCQRELAQMDNLYKKRMKLQALVRHFENNNEYLKIKQTVKQEVECILTNRRQLLKLALLSLTDTMKNDPDKYSRLIYHNTTSTVNYNSQYYDTAPYGQQQQYPSEAYTDMLLEEAHKLYDKLAKDLVDETITDYASNISSSSLLPLLPPPVERQSHPTTTTAANHTDMSTKEHRFTQSEMHDD